MKKAFGQTVRELKREVNKKVLKVPGVEQKILDATSNEPWGPHGSLLSDIAQASRNYPEYQIIMHVLWKRLNDTGKNWRHVYKALTVLEYLVGYGSERVIDEIKEHAYQISTLSDFQYIDSIGKDQGNNVRRKSQTLVSLVNDKEKIQEVRQKALANKDKYLTTFSSSGSYRPSSYSSASGYGDRYDDDRYGRYGSRDDDRNDYGREKDLGYRDDDRYARGGGDFYRDGDRYSRDSDEHYGRDSYKDDDYRGGRGNDDYQLGPRNRSFDKDRDHSYEDDDSYSSRDGGTRANDASPDGRKIERKLSEQSVGAPPSYEASVRNGHTHVHDERDGGVGTATVPKSLPPAAPEASSLQSTSHGPQHAVPEVHSSALTMDDTSFDEFDPRGFMPASSSAPPAANSALQAASGSGVDFFGNSATLDPVNSLALVLATPTTTTNETEVVKTSSYFGMNFVALSSASAALSQPAEDPFGDGPFKAIAGENFPIQQQDSNSVVSAAALLPTSAISTAIPEPVAPVAPKVETPFGFDFGDSLSDLAYMPTVGNGQQYAANPALMASESPLAHPNNDAMGTYVGSLNIQTTNTPFGHTSFPVSGLAAVSSQAAEPAASTYSRTASPGFLQHLGPSIPQAAPLPMQSVQPMVQMNMPPAPMNHTQQFAQSSVNQQPSTTVSGPSNAKQLNDKFETKSSVWTDTLNRGLVNLNISGPKTNPLADIGVDFDSINRMERRKEKEKSSANSITSTVTMGKAMGSGSGIGRAGFGSLNPTTKPAMGSGMGMGMGMGGGAAGLGMGMGMGGPGGMGAGMGGYGGTMNQPMGLGGPGGGMVMNMGMGMGLGGSMRPPAGIQSPPPGLPGAGYNSMGMGGYGSQQPYGGGYR